MTPPPPDLPKLKRKQELAIDALLSGATDSEAAKVARVTRETVWRWRHADADFIAALNLRRVELWRGAADALRGLVPKAVSALAAALDDASPQVRLNAVGIVLRAAGLASGPLAPAATRTAPSEVRSDWVSEAESRERTAQLDALVRATCIL